MGGLTNMRAQFVRGEDPKKSIGIGKNRQIDFKNPEEFTNYVIWVLPIIFGGKIPDDILSKNEQGMLPQSYYEKIRDFLDKMGHTGNGEKIFGDDSETPNNISFAYWPRFIRTELEKMGYQRDPSPL